MSTRVKGRQRMTAVGAILVCAGFCGANAINALRKGGDFQVFLEAGRRVLAGAPLYAGSSPGSGVLGPPFLGLFFVPFAALDARSGVAARLLWYAAGLLFVFGGVRLWAKAWTFLGQGATARSLPGVAFSLLALFFPLQTNFEHQNLNPLLLFLIGGAAFALARDAGVQGGALLGTATALKVFPALLIVHLAYRRAWAALASALLTTVALTLLPIVRYEPRLYLDQMKTWWTISRGGWPTRANNQSLFAAIDRLVGGWEDAHRMASGNPLSFILTAVVVVALLALFVEATWSASVNRETLLREMAMVTVLAVLFSPIAWDHYWVLLFPAYFMAFVESSGRPLARAALVVTAVLTSALTPTTLGRQAFDAVRERSPQTVAALLVFAVLVWSARNARGRREPS